MDQETTKPKEDRVLFLYIRDKNEPRRVLTLARYKKDNELRFAWAINKVTTFIDQHASTHGSYFRKQVEVHDTFKKAMGRKIAQERLLSHSKSSMCVDLLEGERPLKVMLESLAGIGLTNPEDSNVPSKVRMLARQALLNGVYAEETVVPEI